MTLKKPIDKTAIIVAIIVSLPSIIGIWVGYENSHAIKDIHVSINSRMDELIKSTKVASKAEGVAEEKGRKK